MKKFISVVIIVLAIILLNFCTASVQKTVLNPNLKLRNYNNILINLMSSSGSISLTTTTLGQIDSAQMTDGEKQAVLALESLHFELMSMGFNLVSDENQAEAIVEFSIGAIRNDPIAGWIADQAFVRFRDKKTGQILAFYRAKSQAITPTVNNIISKLSEAIRNNY
jgi:hypothetical protein